MTMTRGAAGYARGAGAYARVGVEIEEIQVRIAQHRLAANQPPVARAPFVGFVGREEAGGD